MAIEEAGGYCDFCQRPVLGRRQGLNHTVWALFTLFSCGLIGLLWLIAGADHGSAPYACPTCGRRIRAGAQSALTPEEIARLNAPPPKMTSNAVIIGGALLAVPVVIGLIALWDHMSTRPTPMPSHYAAAAAAESPLPSEPPLKPGASRPEALAHAVRLIGNECPTVTRTFLQGSDGQRTEYWSATCADGKSYRVQLRADHSSSVMLCSTAASMGLRPCFEKLSQTR